MPGVLESPLGEAGKKRLKKVALEKGGELSRYRCFFRHQNDQTETYGDPSFLNFHLSWA